MPDKHLSSERKINSRVVEEDNALVPFFKIFLNLLNLLALFICVGFVSREQHFMAKTNQ